MPNLYEATIVSLLIWSCKMYDVIMIVGALLSCVASLLLIPAIELDSVTLWRVALVILVIGFGLMFGATVFSLFNLLMGVV
jgi:predicted membrane protein